MIVASLAAVGMLGLAMVGATPRPDTLPWTLVVAGGRGAPVVVVREQDTPPLAAIRLSLPVQEPPGLTGTARLLQELARERLEAELRRVGGRVSLGRTSSHVAYTVVGPAEAFAEMAAALRRAMGRPTAAAGGLDAARLRVLRESAAATELPDRVLRRRIEEALYPLLPPVIGNAATLASLRPGDLDGFWREYYRPDRMVVVVVGPVPVERAVAAFEVWAEPPGAVRTRPRRTTPAGMVEPEVIFPWAGLGYAVDDGDPAALAVAAQLIDESLRNQPLRVAVTEMWWGAGRLGLVVIGSGEPAVDGAEPGPGIGERLLTALAEASARATPDAVGRARRTVARQLLFAARTPDGLAELIGEFHDRTGDPMAVLRFLADLEGVDPRAVRLTLDALLEQWPASVELRP